MTQSVPLNKLALSPRNVRKTNVDEHIAGLADSIRSKGLLQNLVVSAAAKSGTFEVDAVGRRLRALRLLAKDKHLPHNWPVPVHVVPRDAATEASLAENLQKIAMNPADEVEAFAAIVDGYEANGMASQAERIANCARRFGVSDRIVGQRLALAALAPDILDALRDGAMTLAAAQAYASHPDHAEQLKIFTREAKSGFRPHDPQRIRDALAGRVYSLDDRLARYVGLDAYREAGGRIEADLFFDDGEREMLIDPALLEKLATEKAQAEADHLADREGWKGAVIRPVTAPIYQSPPTPKGFRRVWTGSDDVLLKDRIDAIAAFALKADGSGIEPLDTHFVPAIEDATATIHKPLTPEERAAIVREQAIKLRAARLATPQTEGTAFEGRAIWPTAHYIDPIRTGPDGEYYVAMIVRVDRADYEAQIETAARQIDLEEAEAEARRKAEEAAPSPVDEPTPPEEEAPADPDQDPNVNDRQEEQAA
ncbi:ParB/RepB/Spo0J family partition protein [Croceicoccus sp. YJ47]|uniref:ParB/RepB/Spo0J family partition protein n=1 Tax=Croceicoccus sp. YJ47 TaxID=2798724 RepID=UPI001922B705|nr:ParB/RepB/Spo0J family partition protein [Croceicoccus sp. YJ47]QQN73144.1 ParB N-terminal domain-containing protein [Croceicoccus sp. YJ47]